MSATEQALDQAAERQGWSRGTQLDLALTYIENQDSPEAWESFLADCVSADNEWDPETTTTDKGVI